MENGFTPELAEKLEAFMSLMSTLAIAGVVFIAALMLYKFLRIFF